MKFIIIIGQSASGKTTYVKKNFIKAWPVDLKPAKMVKVCVSGKNLLLGHYNLGIRCEGTDTLSYASLPAIIEYIPKVINNFENIIAEGDRITNKTFFDFVKSLGVPVELMYFSCPLEVSMERRISTGSKSSEKFVRGTITKSANMLEYAKQLGFEIKIC